MLWAIAANAADHAHHELGRFYALDQVSDERIVAAAASVVDLGYGTGFVVAPSLVLTNHHVAAELGARGLGLASGGAAPVVLELVRTAAELDVALYRLVSESAPPPLEVRIAPPVDGEPVAVVGYPRNEGPSVSFGRVLTNDAVVDGQHRTEYDAQTFWGSSGSPVLDRDGQVIALHWGWDADGQLHGRMLGISMARAAAALPELAEALLCADPTVLRVTSTALAVAEHEVRLRLALDGPENCLAAVEQVTWHLHPTFDNPDVVVERSERRGFPLTVVVWGAFDMEASVRVAGTDLSVPGRVEW